MLMLDLDGIMHISCCSNGVGKAALYVRVLSKDFATGFPDSGV
jgi:hypothetical protein